MELVLRRPELDTLLLRRGPSVQASEEYVCRLKEGGAQRWYQRGLRRGAELRVGARSAPPRSREPSEEIRRASERLNLADTESSRRRQASAGRSKFEGKPCEGGWDLMGQPDRPAFYEPPAHEYCSPLTAHRVFSDLLRGRRLPAPIPVRQPPSPPRTASSSRSPGPAAAHSAKRHL